MIYFVHLVDHFFTLYDPFAMEHPVPQNVTSFEFHLVGDMTLKQFGYLAAGCGFSYIVFAFFFSLSPILSLPVIVLSALLGAAFAFLPIGDRPLDHWVKAFFQAVYSPTQGTWSSPIGKTGQVSQNDPYFKNRLQLYLSTMVVSAPAPTPTFSNQFLNKPTPNIPAETKPVVPTQVLQTTPTTTPAAPTLPSASELNKLVDMAANIQSLKTKIAETEKQISQVESTASPTLSQQQYQQMFSNLQNLLKETEDIYQKTSKEKTGASASPAATQPVVITPTAQATEKLPVLTSSPNVINGIVTDQTGNLLEGVIIIVHNKDGLPVRALKTNKLGQFTGATPLPEGIYNVTFEKEGLTFDTIQTNLNGQIIPPVKICPKKGAPLGQQPAIRSN